MVERLLSTAAADVNVQALTSEEMLDLDPGANGLYHVTKDGRQVFINEAILGTPHSTKVLVHELVHAATSAAMTKNNKTAQKMEALRKRVIAALEDAGDTDALQAYGLENVDEFVAEALSSESFQRILAGVKTGNDKNLWQQFLQVVSDFLGLRPEHGTALAEALSLAPDLFLETEAQVAASIWRRAS